MPSISDLLAQSESLSCVSESPRVEAEQLLCYCLGCERAYLYTWPERELNSEALRIYKLAMARRLKGEPLAYITGTRAFWSLELEVNPSVLIPRSDTETLVEAVLEVADRNAELSIVDLGTGSGAIALALASELPKSNITAIDKSSDALALAKKNALRCGIKNVNFLVSDWFDAMPASTFDFVVSNPPYIPMADPHLLRGDLPFEPRMALVSEEEGLKDINTIVSHAQRHLNLHGVLVIEHGWNQAEAVRDIFRHHNFSDIVSLKDLGGNDRVTKGVKASEA